MHFLMQLMRCEMFSLTETNLRGNLKHICCILKKKEKLLSS